MWKQTGKLTLMCFILCGTSFANGQFTCDPETDCKGASAGDMVPDPQDCEKYYICIELPDGTIRPSTSPLQCEDGYYFNQTFEACAQETVLGTCQNTCSRVCEFECPQPFVNASYVANRLNCSTYYACFQSNPQLVSCIPETPYFNGEKCVQYASQCCNICTPYCSQANTEIVDPCDCSSFYICAEVGTPDESLRGSCDAGYYFDQPTLTCIQGICTEICSSSQCELATRIAI